MEPPIPKRVVKEGLDDKADDDYYDYDDSDDNNEDKLMTANLSFLRGRRSSNFVSWKTCLA